MFCRQCGQQIPDSAVICVHCGVATRGGGLAGAARSRVAYIILGVFLGTFGIHNFYAGYSGKGVAQLLITVLSCGILSLAVWIWVLVEIYTVTADTSGVPFN
jgi:hypothetical protein